jgi:rare lipoprotein A
MFPAGILAALLASSGCAVVGYPAPVRDPLTITEALRPAVPAPDAHADVAPLAPVRSYEVFGRSYTTLPAAVGYVESGFASWYGEPFHGRQTASGETFDMYALTAAHRTLPLTTCVEVRRLDDERSVTVRVNDRGPFSGDTRRIIDLSYSAGRTLGLIGSGTAEVEVRALEAGTAC